MRSSASYSTASDEEFDNLIRLVGLFDPSDEYSVDMEMCYYNEEGTLVSRTLRRFLWRLNQVVSLEPGLESLILNNMMHLFRGEALSWYLDTKDTQGEVEDPTLELDSWCSLLRENFGVKPYRALEALVEARYTIQHLIDGLDIREWIGNLRCTAELATLKREFITSEIVYEKLDIHLQTWFRKPSHEESLDVWSMAFKAQTTNLRQMCIEESLKKGKRKRPDRKKHHSPARNSRRKNK